MRYEIGCFDDLQTTNELQQEINHHLLNVMRDKLTFYCVLYNTSFHRNFNPYSIEKTKSKLRRLLPGARRSFKRCNPKELLSLNLCPDCCSDHTMSSTEKAFINDVIKGIEDHIAF